MKTKRDKQEEAIERQKAHDNLTLDQMIEIATERGGSKKELAKLQAKKHELQKKEEKETKKKGK